MNWTMLLRFRKQVEDLAREEVVLAEWEKSQAVSKRDDLMIEMQTVAAELEQRIRVGIDKIIVEQRYQWLDRISSAMELHTQRIVDVEHLLVGLREKLKKAFHSRRVVELVIAKKEEEIMKKIAAQEQRLQEDVSAHAYTAYHLEENDPVGAENMSTMSPAHHHNRRGQKHMMECIGLEGRNVRRST